MLKKSLAMLSVTWVRLLKPILSWLLGWVLELLVLLLLELLLLYVGQKERLRNPHIVKLAKDVTNTLVRLGKEKTAQPKESG